MSEGRGAGRSVTGRLDDEAGGGGAGELLLAGDQPPVADGEGREPVTRDEIGSEDLRRLVLDASSRALAGHDLFDSATASSLVRVGAYDSALTTLIPALIRDFAGRAPSLCVSALTLGGRAALDALAGDRVDLVIGLARPAGPDFISTPLYEESYRVVGRPDDPLMAGPLDLDAYVAARHIIVSPSGEPRGIVDETLERLGSRRTVAAAHAARFGLVSLPPPLAFRSLPVGAIVHWRNATSPRHVWTIETLVRLTAGMNDPDQVSEAGAYPYI